MTPMKADDIWMIVLIFLSFLLIFRGGKKLIFQQKGRMLIVLGVIAALGAAYFGGGKDKLPEGVKIQISETKDSLRQWTEEKLLGSGGGDGKTAGLLSGLEGTDALMEDIREGLQNTDAIRTFFGGSVGSEAGEGG